MLSRLVHAALSQSGKQLLLIGSLAACGLPAVAQEPRPAEPAGSACVVDLSRPGIMKDIVSNALLRGMNTPELDARKFLMGAESRYVTGEDLLRAAARHFGMQEAGLAGEVERFRHSNCTHGQSADRSPVSGTPVGQVGRAASGEAPEVSTFARDVTLHVVLHELGHALIREFDLPILGNEEAMADAFATHYLTTRLPDRAADVLKARVTSLMIEAREVPRSEWSVRGEHDNDGRRAFQIAALAVAADPGKYASVAEAVGMSDEEVRDARDYGAEIHRSWRRVLSPLWMPEGMRSGEARAVCDEDSGLLDALTAVGLLAELEAVVTGFDWHSQVTIRFVAGEGSAGWSRSKRTISVPSGYIRRFVAQGKAAGL